MRPTLVRSTATALKGSPALWCARLVPYGTAEEQQRRTIARLALRNFTVQATLMRCWPFPAERATTVPTALQWSSPVHLGRTAPRKWPNLSGAQAATTALRALPSLSYAPRRTSVPQAAQRRTSALKATRSATVRVLYFVFSCCLCRREYLCCLSETLFSKQGIKLRCSGATCLILIVVLTDSLSRRCQC